MFLNCDGMFSDLMCSKSAYLPWVGVQSSRQNWFLGWMCYTEKNPSNHLTLLHLSYSCSRDAVNEMYRDIYIFLSKTGDYQQILIYSSLIILCLGMHSCRLTLHDISSNCLENESICVQWLQNWPTLNESLGSEYESESLITSLDLRSGNLPPGGMLTRNLYTPATTATQHPYPI